jgi:DnaJ-domain-containing protein 1
MKTDALGVWSGVVLLAVGYDGLHGLPAVIVLIGLMTIWGMRRQIRRRREHDAGLRSQAEQQQQEAERRRGEAQQRRAQRRTVEQERQAEERRRQGEQYREAERQRHQHEQASNQSEVDDWWSVLEVSPAASADEVRHAYRRKIKRCHPDRVAWLAPGLLAWAERHTRTLNAAYAKANRATRDHAMSSQANSAVRRGL